MATVVRHPQVIRIPRPVARPSLWKRVAALLPALHLPQSDGITTPAAVGATDHELQKLAKRISAGPIDRGDQRDVLVVLYGGGIVK
jgi:hypothetical protein